MGSSNYIVPQGHHGPQDDQIPANTSQVTLLCWKKAKKQSIDQAEQNISQGKISKPKNRSQLQIQRQQIQLMKNEKYKYYVTFSNSTNSKAANSSNEAQIV